jgi:hypothetical protein
MFRFPKTALKFQDILFNHFLNYSVMQHAKGKLAILKNNNWKIVENRTKISSFLIFQVFFKISFFKIDTYIGIFDHI